VAVCDVNDLKRINDTLGHKAGDEVIREACMTVCHTFKHSPVFRTGGDEFVVILNGEDYPIRESLLRDVLASGETRIRSGQYAIAIGMADYIPEEHKSLLSVFEAADKEMYDNKRRLKEIWNQNR
jgi:diguanylate cyclase (GGDEF)-like protein